MKSRKLSLFLLLFFVLMLARPQPSFAAFHIFQLAPPQSQVADRLTYWANQYNIPPVVLKAIAWQESGWRQYDFLGRPLKGYDDIGIGIMQISDYNAFDPAQEEYIDRLKTDFDFNIQEGARILNQKWRMAPKMGDGDRNKIENWYLPIWAYNGWSDRNNPNYALAKGWTPYQDKVFHLIGEKYNNSITFTVDATIPNPSLFPEASMSQNFNSNTTVPSLNANYDTPEKYHLGDLLIDKTQLSSTGGNASVILPIPGTHIEESNGDYWLNLHRNNGIPTSIYALGYYVTGYNALQGEDKAFFQTKIQDATKTVLNYADYKLSSTTDNSDLQAARKWYWSVINLPEGSIPNETRALAHKGYIKVLDKMTYRLAGLNREETAIDISKEGWATSETIVLVDSYSWIDSFISVPLASQKKAPILENPKEKLLPQVQAEIQRLQPKEIIIVGNTLSALIEEELLKTYSVTRYAGKDPVETSVIIAQTLGLNAEKSVVLVNASAQPDAVSVASLAARDGQPILFTNKDKLPSGVADYLMQTGVQQVNFIGGTGVIDDNLVPPSIKSIRLGGLDRYDTLIQVLDHYQPSYENLYFAYGAGDIFADTFSGGPFVARNNGAILFMDTHAIPEKIITYLERIKPYATFGDNRGKIYEFGGEGILGNDADKQIKTLLAK